jgi:hypothetical protein
MSRHSMTPTTALTAAAHTPMQLRTLLRRRHSLLRQALLLSGRQPFTSGKGCSEPAAVIKANQSPGPHLSWDLHWVLKQCRSASAILLLLVGVLAGLLDL